LQALLKAIEKGDIINSGVHQASKDGSVGKGTPKLPKHTFTNSF
jgi:hypothetical protein